MASIAMLLAVCLLNPIVIPTILAPVWRDALPPLPEPTVFGTPNYGLGLGAKGPIGFQVVANNISLVVDEVKAYKKTSNGLSAPEGYAFVIVKAGTVNQSRYTISELNFSLVDDQDNRYVWQAGSIEKFGLSPFSFAEDKKKGSGTLLFEVPLPAIANKLRLRLQPDLSFAGDLPPRLEIDLGLVPLN
jgi:hypothetical protein